MYCPIFTTQLVRQCSVRYSGKLNSTRAATQIVAKMLRDSPNEQLVAVLLDTKLAVIGAHVITHGILDASLAHPREIFRPAILANASAVILAHNHPSGELNASRQDYEVFERCRQAGELIGIACHDAIIVAYDHSGKASGLSLAETRDQENAN
jgi:DNA repair protein RadC